MIAIETDKRESQLDFHVRLFENVKHFHAFPAESA
jgi:hypothetical protein